VSHAYPGSAPRPNALLVTETKTGRGHVTNLVNFARALLPKYRLDAAIPESEVQKELLPYCRKVFNGPRLEHYLSDYQKLHDAGFSPVTLGDLLALYGFCNKDFIQNRFKWWQDFLWLNKTELVVADFAPFAQLAAQSLGVKTANVGMAMTVPPPGMQRFSPILEGDGPKPQIPEEKILDCINKTLVPLGMPELENLPDVFKCDLRFACSLPFWDPYVFWRNEPYFMPFSSPPLPNRRDGRQIFVYLSEHVSQLKVVMDALGQTKLPVRLIINQDQQWKPENITYNNIRIERRLIPPSEIANQARMIICAGQAGISALALFSGIPFLALPQLKEQVNNAHGAARLGVSKNINANDLGRNCSVWDLSELISDMYRDPNYQQRAAHQALQLRSRFPSDTGDAIRRHMSRLALDSIA
jgi:UDP:flavonoid glycosyltransferase YjiC (YdhE family)